MTLRTFQWTPNINILTWLFFLFLSTLLEKYEYYRQPVHFYPTTSQNLTKTASIAAVTQHP